jgi:hypothetical protein
VVAHYGISTLDFKPVQGPPLKIFVGHMPLRVCVDSSILFNSIHVHNNWPIQGK